MTTYTIHLTNIKKDSEYNFYLGRKNKAFQVEASVLHNPFKISRESERENVLEKYKHYLEEQLADPMSDASAEIDKIVLHLYRNCEVKLACQCLPKKCCTEVVAEYISQRLTEVVLSFDASERPEVAIIKADYSTNRKKLYKIKQNPLMQSWGDEWSLDNCLSCNKCKLAEGRKHTVWIRGEGAKRLLIVGEAPGQNEDKTGLPFIGQSGKMLEAMLNSVGIESQRDCWVVNACKCRPPDNRTPKSEEIDACFPYLQSQIVELQPKVILALGTTSTKRLIGKSDFKISNCRGKVYPLYLGKQWNIPTPEQLESVPEKLREELSIYNGIYNTIYIDLASVKVVPTFHPSYLLRNPQKEVGSPKWLVWQDIRLVKQLLDE